MSGGGVEMVPRFGNRSCGGVDCLKGVPGVRGKRGEVGNEEWEEDRGFNYVERDAVFMECGGGVLDSSVEEVVVV